MQTENTQELISEADPQRNDRNRALIAQVQGADASTSEAALTTLVQENMGLVRSLALRFCGRGTDFEDLVQIGTIGMIKAIRSFELERGTAFSTYAVPLIVGEIRRHLRDDGIIKVSRSYRKLGAQLLRLSNEISAAEQREPSVRAMMKTVTRDMTTVTVQMPDMYVLTLLTQMRFRSFGSMSETARVMQSMVRRT